MDPALLTAQIASILAALISWAWWPVFVIAAPIVATIQVTWCCQMKKRGLYAVLVMTVVAFFLSFSISIWMFKNCPSNIFNYDFSDYDHDYYDDYCDYYGDDTKGFAIMALIDSLLFLLVGVSTGYFVVARYDAVLAKWTSERKEEEASDTCVQTVEIMHASPPQKVATATSLPA